MATQRGFGEIRVSESSGHFPVIILALWTLLTLVRYKLVAATEGRRGHVTMMTVSGQVLTCNTSHPN